MGNFLTLATSGVIWPSGLTKLSVFKVKQTTIEAYTHQLYPFDKLKGQRDVSHSPIFDIMLELQDAAIIEKK